MSCQRSFWFCVPLAKQLKQDKVGHGEVTIHNAATVVHKCHKYQNIFKQGFIQQAPLDMSRLVGKPTICICENKDTDQLRGNREADQRLCFRYSDSTISPLLNSKISSF